MKSEMLPFSGRTANSYLRCPPYIASNALAAGDGAGLRPATKKLFTLFSAIAGTFPASVRGTSAPGASARNACFPPAADSGPLPAARDYMEL